MGRHHSRWWSSLHGHDLGWSICIWHSIAHMWRWRYLSVRRCVSVGLGKPDMVHPRAVRTTWRWRRWWTSGYIPRIVVTWRWALHHGCMNLHLRPCAPFPSVKCWGWRRWCLLDCRRTAHVIWRDSRCPLRLWWTIDSSRLVRGRVAILRQWNIGVGRTPGVAAA